MLRRAPRQPCLVTPRLDGLLVGWLAVSVWLGVFAADRLGLHPARSVEALYWVGLVITAAHFGVSYHLAFGERAAALRRRPFAFVIAPACLVIALGALIGISYTSGPDSVRELGRAMITSVYLLTTWHYVKQVYGVGRVAAAYSRTQLTSREAAVLRYGLYPLWVLGASKVLLQSTNYHLAGFRVGYSVAPEWTQPTLRLLALLSAVPVFAVIVRSARRSGRAPSSMMLAPYVAAYLWLGLPTDVSLTVVLLAPFHALQYLAIANRAELALADSDHGVRWWLNIFAGSACGGLLLTLWIPRFLDLHLHSGRGPMLFTGAFFVFLNLHHYVIDATIWRSDGRLIKAMGRKPVRASG